MAPRTDVDLLALQGSIKRDPKSYEEEFKLQLRHYMACLAVFALKPSEETQEFTSLVTFIAQVSSSYPESTQNFPKELSSLLEKHYAVMNTSLRHTVVKSLILLRNRNQVTALELLPLFFKLFRCQDKSLRQLLFKHIIADIKTSNQKHHNVQLNRAIQNFMYSALEDPHEAAAKKSLAVLIELWRRQVWRDVRTVNVIASAALHSSKRLMLAALKFFLGQDEDDESDNDDDEQPKAVNPSKADIYSATKKGTSSSKKKKAAKLKRVMAAVKKQQRRTHRNFENFAAIQLLRDPQEFAEALFKRLHKSSGERFEVRVAMMSVISRVVGVHRLLLLNFYPFMQKYVLPHQRDAPQLLAIIVQAVHEEVPPDTLAPVLRQLVDQFVHDRARPEVMTLGLKTVREMCERAPLIMSTELLQDLALYKKFREKEVSSAARALISLFRELAPSMLQKQDRGRDPDMQAAPLAFGLRKPASRVVGADLLQADLERGEGSDDDEEALSEGGMDEPQFVQASGEGSDEEGSDMESEGGKVASSELSEVEASGSDELSEAEFEGADAENLSDIDSVEDDESNEKEAAEPDRVQSEEDASVSGRQAGSEDARPAKRSRDATAGSLNSLRKEVAEAEALKKARIEAEQSLEGAGPGAGGVPLEYERMLTEEDFARIRELRHQKMVDDLMRKHGLKSAAKRERLLAAAQDEADEALEKEDQRSSLAESKVAADTLKGRHKSRMSKAEKLAVVMEGREGRDFGSAKSRRQQKTGGFSNKEKSKKKNLPMGAKKAIVLRRAGKQAVGKKNFKGHSRPRR